MSVSVKKSALVDFLRNALFEREDVQYGLYDRPIGDAGNPDGEDETTVPPDVPIEPAEMMATQLADDRPPIEDDEYIPANPTELGRAADVIAKMVPDDKVEKFYRDIISLLDDVVASHNDPEAPSEPTEEEVQEEAVRRAARAMIEAISNWDTPRYDYDDDYDDEELSVQQWDAGDDEVEPAGGPDEMSFEDLAAVGGYSSPSGARQDIERLLSRMKYLGTELPAGDLESLRDFGATEFIDEMLSGGYLDEEDVVELQQNLGAVKNLDSFRFFFVSAILMPAYQEVKRTARKGVEAAIGKLGVPKKTHQTILNQALGETPRNPGKLTKKLTRDFMEENPGNKNAAADAGALAKKVNDAMIDLTKLAAPGNNILDLAKARWGKQSKGRRAKSLEQALQSTTEFQEEIADAK